MRTPSLAALSLAALAALAAPPVRAADDTKPAGPAPWVFPQDVKSAGRRLTLHEPQVTAFEPATFKVTLRFPTTLTDALGRAAMGCVNVTGQVHVNVASRLMRLDGLFPGSVAFPTVAAADATAVEGGLGDALPKALTLRLELLTARPGNASAETQPAFKVQMPAIFVRLKPAVLIQIDGDPVMLDVAEFPLQYLANSASDVFRDPKTDMWYLLVNGAWMHAKALAGPWKKLDGGLPPTMSQLPGNHPRGHIRRFVPGTAEFTARGNVPPPKELPEIIISNVPSELVLLYGDPLFTFVPGVRLMPVANTESDLFFHPKTNLYYLLVAGRWFTTEELDGKWTDAASLPEEFQKIPRDSVHGHVVWCVPGTPEAAEACALASLEDRASVNKYVQVQVLFEGKEPVTEALDGDVKIVTNTEDDCFLVGKDYFVCQRGLWYRSQDPHSSWKACADLPAPLAKLPETSNAYHVTACRPLGLEGETASFAIRGGYYGTFATKGAPVYGTGATRRGFARTGMAGANWYPCARTWGESRWYDPTTGVFQPRTVRYGIDGVAKASEWSPYTASYGRVLLYGCRYDQGGRRMFPYSDEMLKFDTASARPNVWALWLSELKKREGLDLALFPFGDRSTETPPEAPRLACDEAGKCWRIGPKGPETWDKGNWGPSKTPAPPEITAWLETLSRIDGRPEVWKRWRDLRAAPIPVYATVTEKAK